MIDIPGYRVVKVLGAVYGLSVRARNLAAGVWGVTKSAFGGETKVNTQISPYYMVFDRFRLVYSPVYLSFC